ncbi:putative G-protein coupled receptor 156 [Platysternon megacephalum]|uniref:Putative G-protein coupled receptor 156 n=1 Tax=Platysternon megacephalum TaxID=55544 RepID=A0A4D9E9Z3_9SAUR|nr:putative G-protein coupled receptor 156 [Platysternon megacephalum]
MHGGEADGCNCSTVGPAYGPRSCAECLASGEFAQAKLSTGTGPGTARSWAFSTATSSLPGSGGRKDPSCCERQRDVSLAPEMFSNSWGWGGSLRRHTSPQNCHRELGWGRSRCPLLAWEGGGQSTLFSPSRCKKETDESAMVLPPMVCGRLGPCGRSSVT